MPLMLGILLWAGGALEEHLGGKTEFLLWAILYPEKELSTLLLTS